MDILISLAAGYFAGSLTFYLYGQKALSDIKKEFEASLFRVERGYGFAKAEAENIAKKF